MDKDLNFVSRYRATRKRLTRASFGGVGLMMGGFIATQLIGFSLPAIPMILVCLAGLVGSLGSMFYVVTKAEFRQEDFMANFYHSLGIDRRKSFANSDFSEGAILEEFDYTFPNGRRGLVSVVGTGKESEPRVVFAENASAKVLESTSTTAKEITA